MTNPRGKEFISYRRPRGGDVKRLIEAHHDVGIPTWQDITDLDEGPTEDQLRSTIRDPNTASGLMWLTPDIAESKMIVHVEAPELLQRARVGDAFILVPVATGGLGYAEANAMFDGVDRAADIGNWNVRKADDAEEAINIATRAALTRRVREIHSALDEAAPFGVGLYVRGEAPEPTNEALLIDWSHRFSNRVAQQAAWNEFMLPALDLVSNAIRVHAPGRRVIADGLASVPSGIALGHAFLSTRNVPIWWKQRTAGRADQLWGLDASSGETDFVASTRAGHIDGTDLAVLISVTEDVGPAVAASTAQLPPFRAIVDVRKHHEPPHVIESASEAVAIADVTIKAIRRARSQYNGIAATHIFAAAPFGLAMLIGQLLNTIGPVQTYEHVPIDAQGRYEPGCLLKPHA